MPPPNIICLIECSLCILEVSSLFARRTRRFIGTSPSLIDPVYVCLPPFCRFQECALPALSAEIVDFLEQYDAASLGCLARHFFPCGCLSGPVHAWGHWWRAIETRSDKGRYVVREGFLDAKERIRLQSAGWLPLCRGMRRMFSPRLVETMPSTSLLLQNGGDGSSSVPLKHA